MLHLVWVPSYLQPADHLSRSGGGGDWAGAEVAARSIWNLLLEHRQMCKVRGVLCLRSP